MSKWAVAYTNFSENDLTIAVVEAISFYDAIKQHPQITKYDSNKEWLLEMVNWDDEAIKQAFFDCDSQIAAVKIE